MVGVLAGIFAILIGNSGPGISKRGANGETYVAENRLGFVKCIITMSSVFPALKDQRQGTLARAMLTIGCASTLLRNCSW
jgi:hypothetical protein